MGTSRGDVAHTKIIRKTIGIMFELIPEAYFEITKNRLEYGKYRYQFPPISQFYPLIFAAKSKIRLRNRANETGSLLQPQSSFLSQCYLP
jgi:hypothetical protein